MRLFHFSEDPAVARFEPRPVRTPSARPPGREWLNGPLVWAIDEPHQAMYLFPADRAAYVEARWLPALNAARLYRYELPVKSFESLDDAGMWVAREAVTPLAMEELSDLPGALSACGVDLRVVESLTPLRGVWETTLHASGIRLRNAVGW